MELPRLENVIVPQNGIIRFKLPGSAVVLQGQVTTMGSLESQLKDIIEQSLSDMGSWPAGKVASLQRASLHGFAPGTFVQPDNLIDRIYYIALDNPHIFDVITPHEDLEKFVEYLQTVSEVNFESFVKGTDNIEEMGLLATLDFLYSMYSGSKIFSSRYASINSDLVSANVRSELNIPDGDITLAQVIEIIKAVIPRGEYLKGGIEIEKEKEEEEA